MSYDKSTGDGQKRLFYEVHSEVAATNAAKLAELSYSAGAADMLDGIAARYPTNADYMRGYNTNNLNGIRFERDGVEWKVLRYHRGDAWLCEEKKNKTTCEFYTKQITDSPYIYGHE